MERKLPKNIRIKMKSKQEKIIELQNQLKQKKNISTGTTKINLKKEYEISKKHITEVINKTKINNTKNKKSLDIGSGNGHKTIALGTSFKQAIGIEPVKEE